MFAREPTPGRTKARLALGVGSATAAVLADAFLRDTLAKVTKLGVQLVIAADTPHGVKKSPYFLRLARTYGAELNDQAGGALGARMSGALRPYLENGAILIGSDAPSLPLGHLKRAFALLARRFDVVVGPTVDGGYYLVGARGALPEIFRDMPGGEETVFQETVRRLRAAENRYAVAPWWYDIDEEADLMMLAAHLFRRKSLGVRFNASMPLGRKCPCPNDRSDACPAWNLSSRSICMRLSVIVPVLNEQEVLEHTLVAIRNGAVDAEIVVVDGGSADNSLYIARKFADQVISAPRGRARQQNYGAERCGGEVLAFAHADTIVPSTFSQDIGSALKDLRICGGWFDVKLDGGARLASLIGRLISLRSRLMRSGTGDQAIFIRRAVFESLGGFPQIPICEDVASCAGSSTPGESPVYGPK